MTDEPLPQFLVASSALAVFVEAFRRRVKGTSNRCINTSPFAACWRAALHRRRLRRDRDFELNAVRMA